VTDTVKLKTRAFLAQSFQHLQINDADDIYSQGFVNSLFAMQLVLFLEKEFAITIQDDDLRLDNFRSVNALADLVKRKHG
jgi:methoxymalonate biosynthesis acyl carrier protein